MQKTEVEMARFELTSSSSQMKCLKPLGYISILFSRSTKNRTWNRGLENLGYIRLTMDPYLRRTEGSNLMHFIALNA